MTTQNTKWHTPKRQKPVRCFLKSFSQAAALKCSFSQSALREKLRYYCCMPGMPYVLATRGPLRAADGRAGAGGVHAGVEAAAVHHLHRRDRRLPARAQGTPLHLCTRSRFRPYQEMDGWMERDFRRREAGYAPLRLGGWAWAWARASQSNKHARVTPVSAHICHRRPQ